jgi:hypothetical protein
MNITLNSLVRSLVALLAATALSACTTPSDTTGHEAHHPDQTAGSATPGAAPSGTAGGQSGAGMMGGQSGGSMMGGQTGGAMMGGTAASQMGPGGMDTKQMCAMYRNMQSAPADQRQAMMDQQMKGMSPEMRQQHWEMMRQQCK